MMIKDITRQDYVEWLDNGNIYRGVVDETQGEDDDFLQVVATSKYIKKDDYFKKKVFNKKHADWFMDGAEAKRHGLVNHLRVPKMTVKVDVDIDFE